MVITAPIPYLVRAPIYQLIPIKRSLMEKNISAEGETRANAFSIRVSRSNVNLQRGVYRSEARAWLRAEENKFARETRTAISLLRWRVCFPGFSRHM